MRRRDFITFLGGAAGWPIAPTAQQPPMPIVGFVSGREPSLRCAETRYHRVKFNPGNEGNNHARS
jgi:hypothetical protein